MNTIPTALEFYNSHSSPQKGWSIEMIMIEFTRLHVENATEVHANHISFHKDEKKLIRESYPLTNIK
jgi:hypothetical protein